MAMGPIDYARPVAVAALHQRGVVTPHSFGVLAYNPVRGVWAAAIHPWPMTVKATDEFALSIWSEHLPDREWILPSSAEIYIVAPDEYVGILGPLTGAPPDLALGAIEVPDPYMDEEHLLHALVPPRGAGARGFAAARAAAAAFRGESPIGYSILNPYIVATNTTAGNAAPARIVGAIGSIAAANVYSPGSILCHLLLRD